MTEETSENIVEQLLVFAVADQRYALHPEDVERVMRAARMRETKAAFLSWRKERTRLLPESIALMLKKLVREEGSGER
jgi:hypothetical protein